MLEARPIIHRFVIGEDTVIKHLIGIHMHRLLVLQNVRFSHGFVLRMVLVNHFRAIIFLILFGIGFCLLLICSRRCWLLRLKLIICFLVDLADTARVILATTARLYELLSPGLPA